MFLMSSCMCAEYLVADGPRDPGGLSEGQGAVGAQACQADGRPTLPGSPPSPSSSPPPGHPRLTAVQAAPGPGLGLLSALWARSLTGHSLYSKLKRQPSSVAASSSLPPNYQASQPGPRADWMASLPRVPLPTSLCSTQNPRHRSSFFFL